MNVEFEGAEKLMARLDKMSDEAALKKALRRQLYLLKEARERKRQKILVHFAAQSQVK